MHIAEITQVGVKRYHGCWKVNRNSTYKLIDYRRGKRCLFPINDCCWRKTKAKYLVERPYLTRRRVRLIKRLKKIHIVAGLE